MEKKYELLKGNTILRLGTIVYRIRALKDFGDVKAGDLGGFVESENNLSQEGTCWVYDNSTALGSAKVSGNAKIYDSLICGNAEIKDSAIVTDTSLIKDNSLVKDGAFVINSVMNGNSIVKDRANVKSVNMFDNSCISGDAIINDNTAHPILTILMDNSFIGGTVRIIGGTFAGDAKLLQSYIADFNFSYGYVLDGNMEVRYPDEIMVINVAGLERILARNSEGGIICYKCPASTGDELLEVIKKTCKEDSEDYIKYTAAINLLKETIKFNDIKESMK